jgi:hypothetical protein
MLKHQSIQYQPVRWLLLLSICALLMGGCASVVAESKLPEVTFTARALTFEGPESIPGGWVRVILRNEGQEYYHLQLVKLNEGMGVADLGIALRQSLVPPVWAEMRGGPNAVDPGQSTSAILYLEAGDYALISTVPDRQGVPHVANGMIRGLTVTKPTSATREPDADVTLDLVDFSFVLSQPLAVGEQTIRVNNQGSHAHEIWLAKLGEGKSANDLLMALAPGSPAEDWVYNGLGGLAWIEPGSHGYFTANLEPGRYALICFVPDHATGKMHFMLGMVQEFVVK